MKNLLKILFISSLSACNNNTDSHDDLSETDTTAINDSGRIGRNQTYQNKTQDHDLANPSEFEQSEKEREITRQITSALISTKTEINQMRSGVSDSLTKTGLTTERRSFFVKTIKQLDISSDLVNKELENIMVTDLQKNHEKLSAVVKKMKTSEKELGAMISRLDRINSYLEAATVLIQTLLPSIPAPATKQVEK